MLLLGILLLVGGYVLTRPVPKILGGNGTDGVLSTNKTGATAPVAGGTSAAPVAGGNAGLGNFAQVPELEPLSAGNPFIVVSAKTQKGWKYIVSLYDQHLTNDDLLDMGYTIPLTNQRPDRHGMRHKSRYRCRCQ